MNVKFWTWKDNIKEIIYMFFIYLFLLLLTHHIFCSTELPTHHLRHVLHFLEMINSQFVRNALTTQHNTWQSRKKSRPLITIYSEVLLRPAYLPGRSSRLHPSLPPAGNLWSQLQSGASLLWKSSAGTVWWRAGMMPHIKKNTPNTPNNQRGT